jgi:hypothetical protein
MSDNSNNLDMSNKTYRFKFSNDIIELLKKFSLENKTKSKKEFDIVWEKFLVENNQLINDEITLVKRNGYVGDVNKKMYNSVRYYYCKKDNANIQEKTIKKRKKYIGLPKEILKNIDEHINNNIKDNNYKPSVGFDNYYTSNYNMLNELYINNYDSDFDKKEFENKIKKTYKNRHYNISKR